MQSVDTQASAPLPEWSADLSPPEPSPRLHRPGQHELPPQLHPLAVAELPAPGYPIKSVWVGCRARTCRVGGAA